VTISAAILASLATPPPVVVSVQLPEVTSFVAAPAIALSRSSVILALTVAPQVPLKSPVAGRAKPKREVYAVVMFIPGKL
jgi:hypothetical protein